jgi:oxygen-dependent protoporphyrinogen oxidase
MIGGATNPGVVDLDDQRLVDLVRADLRQTMRLANVPEFAHVIRHRCGIPQYTVGHGGRLARLDTILQRHPGLFLAGSSYRGVAVNSCIEAAPRIAADIAHHLRREPFLSRQAIAAS